MNFETRNNKVYNKNDNRLQFSSIRLLARLECAHCLTQSTTTEKKWLLIFPIMDKCTSYIHKNTQLNSFKIKKKTFMESLFRKCKTTN